jgi:tetratricopeptide (TPR) repeat protein
MSDPTVFISYSHRDKKLMDELLAHLKPYVRSGSVTAWSDKQIVPGSKWLPEIQTALGKAGVALLLVSPQFLASDFIHDHELGPLLKSAEAGGVKILWVQLRESSYRETPLQTYQAVVSPPAKPLIEMRSERDRAWVQVCEAVKAAVNGSSASVGASAGDQRLDIGRLPIPGPNFLGRDAELSRLDTAWEEPRIHVLTFVAFGGVGKSALIHRWMDRMAADGWRGATRVLDWSFYSQGMENRVTSAEPFIDHALRFFGDPDPQAGSLHDRGARLADLIRKERSLLVLDGIEPLQYPPGRPEIEGRLKDPGLAALLKRLAAGNPGLCVVTTREKISDLFGFSSTAPQSPLEKLEPDAAVPLLRQLGVNGRENELLAAAEAFQCHALTLTLLGNFLRRAHGGDVRKWREIDLYDASKKQGGHAARVIGAYARWLGEGPELAILRFLGFFDRPAEVGTLKALRATPPIPELTESLVDLSNEDWNLAVATLREHSLLLAADLKEPETLDAHPLVRACFAEELESHRSEAWQEGNRRLYEHLCQAAPDFPETLEAMQPLFAAVVHGCRAGRQQEVMDKVYWRRIQREGEFYSSRKLGAFGSELTALAGFFDRPWSQPSARLTAGRQAFLLSVAAFDLCALGRLVEAVEPMQVGLGAYVSQEKWKSAAAAAGDLSELTLLLGEVPRAVALGEQGVELADRSRSRFRQTVNRTTWGDALHQAGRWEESADAFRKAEAMQAEWQPKYSWLYSLQGFQYCDLLLGRAEPKSGAGLDELAKPNSRSKEAERFRLACREVLERANRDLPFAEKNGWLLNIALDHLSLGRAQLGLALTKNRRAGLTQAAEHLNQTVDGVRRAGHEDDLPRGLLARAALRRFLPDFAGAAADLAEALKIAERGPMRLHECDAHLEWARLCRDQGELAEARRHVARARELVEETGYGRRRREVEWFGGGVRTPEVILTRGTSGRIWVGERSTRPDPSGSELASG